MNIKFKATLIILALMLLTSLILAKRESVSEIKHVPVEDSVSQNISVNEKVEISKQVSRVRYIHQPVKPQIQEIKLSEGLNTNLPLPELMQNVGFKINIESDIDYANIDLVVVE